MSEEEIVISYPPSPLIIDYVNLNMKKEIEINLFNKTINNVLYKINSKNNNIFRIENPLSIIKPLSSQNIKIFFNNNPQNELNNKLEIIFNFYLLNIDVSNLSNLNKIYEEKMGHENQKKIINIFLKNKPINEKNEEEKYIKDIIPKYSKFKNDLNEINNKIKNIIELNVSNINKKKNKYIVLLVFIILIIIFGFIIGLILSKKYNKLFKKKGSEKIIDSEDDKDFVDVKFMSVKEANEINDVYDENLIKFNKLKDFNFLNEAKKSREIIDNLNKKNNASKKVNYGNYISINIFIYIFYFIIYIYLI